MDEQLEGRRSKSEGQLMFLIGLDLLSSNQVSNGPFLDLFDQSLFFFNIKGQAFFSTDKLYKILATTVRELISKLIGKIAGEI